MRSDYLKTDQKRRIFRVYALSRFYSCYRDIYLDECSLNHQNTYTEAEKTSEFINALFNADTKPVDFIHQEEKLINDLIAKNKTFRDEVRMIDQLGIGLKEKTIMAFCKSVEHGDFHILKMNVQFYYQVMSLYNYCAGYIDKESLIEGMEEVSIFTKKRKHNNKLFKKTFLKVEDLYYEILKKQILREYKTIKF